MENLLSMKFRWTRQSTERVQPIQTIHDRTDRIQSLAFSPKDKYLAVGCIDGGFDLYDARNQFKNLRFKNSNPTGAMSSLYCSSFFFKDNVLSVTNIDWTEDEAHVQYTGENKQDFIVKVSCRFCLSRKSASYFRCMSL